MEYTITVKELLQRPVINPKRHFGFMQKMTDEEITQWEYEVKYNLEEGDDEYYDLMSKTMDRDILYNLFKLGLHKAEMGMEILDSDNYYEIFVSLIWERARSTDEDFKEFWKDNEWNLMNVMHDITRPPLDRDYVKWVRNLGEQMKKFQNDKEKETTTGDN